MNNEAVTERQPRTFIVWDDGEEDSEKVTYREFSELQAVEKFMQKWHDESGLDDTRIAVQREDGTTAIWDAEIEMVPSVIATRIRVLPKGETP